MRIRISEALLRWRWLVMALAALLVIAMEVVEHWPQSFNLLDPDLVREALVFGIAFPLVGGIALDVLARTRLGQEGKAGPLINKIERRGTNVQRVLIVENSLLLGAGVQSLLAAEANLDVIGISPKDQAELIQEIERFQPDVVVLDDLTHLTDTARLLTFLEVCPELRVVVLSSNSNLVRVYYRQRALITQVTDLVRILHASQRLS